MKKFTILMSILCLVVSLSADHQKDKQEIKQLIQTAYIDGAFVKNDGDAMEKGFYKDFSIFINSNGEVKRYPIKKWAESARKRKAEGKKLPWKLTWKLPVLDITGDAAMGKIEIFKDGKILYTDYQGFYRLNGKWTIVAKIFQKH